MCDGGGSLYFHSLLSVERNLFPRQTPLVNLLALTKSGVRPRKRKN
jgi:hypothetical protein